jgi:hypothetical protein
MVAEPPGWDDHQAGAAVRDYERDLRTPAVARKRHCAGAVGIHRVCPGGLPALTNLYGGCLWIPVNLDDSGAARHVPGAVKRSHTYERPWCVATIVRLGQCEPIRAHKVRALSRDPP